MNISPSILPTASLEQTELKQRHLISFYESISYKISSDKKSCKIAVLALMSILANEILKKNKLVKQIKKIFLHII